MKKGIALLFVIITLGHSVVLAENIVKKSDDLVVLNKGLQISSIGRYSRSPVHRDALEEQVVSGKWSPPQKGDKIIDPEGQEHEWVDATANDDGWFADSNQSGGYLYVPVHSDSRQIMILHMKGNTTVTVNGQPHVGSRYQTTDHTDPWAPSFDFARLPVQLRKGVNEFLFKRTRRAGGRVKASLLRPDSKVLFNISDMTLPDVIAGQNVDTFGAIVVINASDKKQDKLSITTKWGDGTETVTDLPSIPPLSIRKVRFDLKHHAFSADDSGVKVQLYVKVKGTSKAHDSIEIPLNIKKQNEPYKRTFISSIDNSVQYYAVTPAAPQKHSIAKPGLVLSVHGASVEAINQAGSYANKSWCNIVCPTNRRPYGFDWEDWGMIDAVEVLEDAKNVLGYDPSRVYLTGHSMGGHGTWVIGSTYPDQFGAIAPSAGWISFKTYARGKEGEDTEVTEMEKLLSRAENPGDPASLIKNLSDKGVYILHGGADKVVSAKQAQKMTEYLGEFHRDWVYHEEPGQGHWWDLSDEPGADCVDWMPLFDFFARHRLVGNDEKRQINFTTANPAISSHSHWVQIYDQIKPLEYSSVDIHVDPGKRRFVGTTDNVAILALSTDGIVTQGDITIELDGQKLNGIQWPKEKNKVWLSNYRNKWTVAEQPSKAMKGPHRYGPFKRAFDNNMIFVYGTKGSAEENQWAFAKARFDAEQWWYQGNGAVDMIADSQLSLKATKDRSVILYGNSETNSAWKKLVPDSPIEVTKGNIRIGNRNIAGDDLSCLFLRPRADSDLACVALVAGTGIKGMKLTNNLQYLFAGCNYPDYIVIGPEMLTKGHQGVLATGYFGSDWTVESGDFVLANRQTDEQKSSELPAYIGPDPREFEMPRHYICMKAADQITVDGKMDEESWSKALWSEPHVDIQGSARPVTPRFETRFKMLWDNENLYVAAKLSEPHIWGTITERNAVIFNDNDFEVFIDPDGDSHSYYEFEMNALNTVWNLYMDRPYKHGGNAVIREMPGQKTGVFVKGTLNDPTDEDEYWTVEIAMPFKGMAEYAGVDCPPTDGDQWRIGFSRVEWEHEVVNGSYVRVPEVGAPHASGNEENWIWSPQGVINMHRPETWGYLQYSQKSVGSTGVEFIEDQTAKASYLLHKILYAQEAYILKHDRYAVNLADLGLGDLADKSLAEPIKLQSDGKKYTAIAKVKLSGGKTVTVHLSSDGRTWTE